ncbi:MAG: IS4 family transposase [Desulfovermiculus sp.]|nr:IS4 family transposase [Desulfovermiculus sp.]
MHHIEITKKELGKHLDWNAARIQLVALFITALFKARSVSISKIAIKMDGKANKESRCKRISNFFAKFTFSYDDIALCIMKICGFYGENVVLAVDRTNWKFGKLDINILTLAIATDGLAIPIMWIFLPKQGNSNTKERISLINRYIKVFGKENIDCLVADREFVGTDWFIYLTRVLGISVRIRIKDSYKINKKSGDLAPVKNFFINIAIGQTKILEGKRYLWGLQLFFIGTKSKNGELVIVVTESRVYTALEDYAKRWGIETMFKALKSKGFDFESTHLNNYERLSKMTALLAIAFAWAYKVGTIENKIKKIKIKSHGRKAVSIFRYGLDILDDILSHIGTKIHEFKHVAKLLSCT